MTTVLLVRESRVSAPLLRFLEQELWGLPPWRLRMLSRPSETSVVDHTNNLPRASAGSFQPVAGAQQPARIEGPSNPVETIAFGVGLVLLFLRTSMIHQLQPVLMGFNLRLLYVFGLPALLGVVVVGGVQRSFRRRPAFYWAGFAVWMAVATPFSAWRMGSVILFTGYLRTDLIMLFIIGGLVRSWQGCKLMMYAIAWGAVVNIFTGRLLGAEERFSGRLGLEFGSISNPNDFAGHLLFTLPFLLWVGLSARSVVVRSAALLGVFYGIYIVLMTGSRGAFLGLAVAALFFLFRGGASQRIALLGLAPVVVMILALFLPHQIWRHIRSFSATSADADPGAIESSETRQYTLRKSIEYTLQHPIVGVGPGQFAWYEGLNNRYGGTTHGFWHETHNTFTQVSSECGIPAFILFLCGIISTFRLVNATYRQARPWPECKDIAVTAFCIMLAMVTFCTAIFFLSFAYFFYLPALAGLAIALDRTAQAEFSSRAARALEPQQPPWGAPPRGFHTGAERVSPGLPRTARQAAL